MEGGLSNLDGCLLPYAIRRRICRKRWHWRWRRETAITSSAVFSANQHVPRRGRGKRRGRRACRREHRLAEWVSRQQRSPRVLDERIPIEGLSAGRWTATPTTDHPRNSLAATTLLPSPRPSPSSPSPSPLSLKPSERVRDGGSGARGEPVRRRRKGHARAGGEA